MAEEYAFARKASGLVRGLSLFDAFGIGLIFIMPIYEVWYSIQVGVGLYPGANLVITVLISFVTVGLAAPLVWGILGGTMPRSGGEYIYNSRVINAPIAMAASFCQMAAIFYWNIFMSCWIASPALAILGGYLGWAGLTNFALSKWGTFALAMACYAAALISVAFGMRVYKLLQRPIVVIGIAGPCVLALVLSLTSKATFIRHWNAAATQYHSLGYQAFITAVGHAAGAAMPRTWSWGDTLGATTGVFMIFVYAYAIAYVGGEVKRPDKTLIKANYLSVLVPTVICLWSFVAIYHAVGFTFLGAAAHSDLNGAVKGYAFPYATDYMSLTFIASGMNRVVGIIAALTFLLSTYWIIAVSLMVPQRALFAWGMDRMGPKWFTNVSARWGVPTTMYCFVAVVSAIFTAVYLLWWQSALGGLVAAGMQIVSLFAVTAISAIILPYRKKTRTIWDASPFRSWKVLGVPVLTIAGVVYLAYMVCLLYFAYLDPKTRDVTGKNLYVFAGVWIAGIAWYLYWKSRSKSVGVDVNLTYGELPPE